jgi:hypothetical protein
MPSRKPFARVSCLAALFAACGLLAPQPAALASHALAAAVEDVPEVIACAPSHCASARSAERYLMSVSQQIGELASRLASADRGNVLAEVAASNARHCADRVGLLDSKDADALPLAFRSVAASCEMASAALRQAYRAEQEGRTRPP